MTGSGAHRRFGLFQAVDGGECAAGDGPGMDGATVDIIHQRLPRDVGADGGEGVAVVVDGGCLRCFPFPTADEIRFRFAQRLQCFGISLASSSFGALAKLK